MNNLNWSNLRILKIQIHYLCDYLEHAFQIVNPSRPRNRSLKTILSTMMKLLRKQNNFIVRNSKHSTDSRYFKNIKPVQVPFHLPLIPIYNPIQIYSNDSHDICRFIFTDLYLPRLKHGKCERGDQFADNRSIFLPIKLLRSIKFLQAAASFAWIYARRG